MDSIELKDYIEHIKDLEVSCYKQNCYINELNSILGKVQHPALYSKVERKKIDNNGIISAIFLGIFGIFCSLLVGVVVDIFLWIVLLGLTFICAIFGYESPAPEWTLIVIFGIPIILCLLFGIWAFICGIIDSIKGKGKQKQLDEEVEKENQHRAELNKAISSQVPIKVTNVQQEITRAKEQYNETYALLQKYYDENIIYKDYRGLVPMCMIYQYFASGRCSQLEGPDGAYNKYENEKTMRVIVTQLNEIIKSLDRIEENQRTIADAIKDTRSVIGTLSNAVQLQTKSLDRIENNQEIANYYNQINATNTAYLSWITTHKYIAEKSKSE